MTIVKAVVNSSDVPVQGSKCILFFWAPWHEASSSGGQIDQVFSSLAQNSPSDGVSFLKVEAESFPEISLKYGVTIVPTFVLLDEQGEVVDKVEGMDVAKITQAVHLLVDRASAAGSFSEKIPENSTVVENLDEKLTRLVNSSEVMLFMKGTPQKPRCGFSRQVVEILEVEGVGFATFDILDENAQDVREGLKTKFSWPTYPQLYVKGELIGGLDIVKEMVKEHPGGLKTALGLSMSISTEESLHERLEKLVNRSKVMLFMKGLPSSPRCGFSRQICDILNLHTEVSYDAFDILQDEEVRQGLKSFSDWPTFPQLYVNGELVGGLDIVKELQESGELGKLLTE